MKNIKRLSWLFVAIMFAVTPISVMAQETSSAIGGTVVDSDGNPVTGATVVIKHTPTGATKTLTTNNKGNYQARGLRVGGPYTVSISSDGYGDVNESDVYIKLGETRDIDATIVSDTVSLDAIQVVGVAQSVVFNADNMGSGTTIDRDMLENMPTISRSITDFVRIDSRINIRDFGDGISVSGVNNRFNNFSIDGVATNDPFGLEAGGFPGLSQPFNMDTIEELNVKLTPYDVTLSSFTGASINAVTKSGTNEFSGTLNVQYGNEDFVRDDDSPFTNEIYSVTLGGPIIKDKLFFFVGYENSGRSRLINGSGISLASLQEIADIARDVWGFDAGALTPPTDSDITKENLLVKLDWNINDSHRASFRYTTNEDVSPQFRNFGSTRASLGSHWYDNSFQNDSYALNFYSDWTPNFTTEVRLSRSDFKKRPINNSRLPQIEIRGVSVGDASNGIVLLGTETNRHASNLETQTDIFYFEGNYFAGNHTIKAGFDIQNSELNNVFRRNSLGSYRFNSPEDFANGTPSRYNYQIGINPSDPYPAANWDWTGTGIFIQDNWMVNDRLTIQYGLRWDKPSVGSKPEFNQGFYDAFGIRNDNTIDSGILQPRIGFNFDMSDELAMQLRGGIGLFSGGAPNVWLSNPYTNTGLNTFNVDNRDFESGELVFSPDPDNQPFPADPGFQAQNVDLLEDGFKLPTVIKTNIALDAELPWYGLVATFEYEYIKQQDAVFFEQLNLGESTGVMPDGRLSYRENPLDMSDRNTRPFSNPDFKDVYLLRNTGAGDLRRATISLSKTTEHFFTQASYTHTSSSEVHGGTSSIAASNWENRPAINPNDSNETAISTYQIENAFTFMINYNNNFFGDTITDIGLFWTSSDGEPYSYVYSNDVNGDDNRRDVDLFYVPNQGEYVLIDPSQVDAFEAFLVSSGLDQYRGQIAPRNAFKAPRINLWDLKVSQELPEFGFGRASLFFSIQNLGNLLNSDWGQVHTAFFRGERVGDLEGFDEQGRYIIDWNTRSGDGITFESRNRSQWQAQVGFRFEF